MYLNPAVSALSTELEVNFRVYPAVPAVAESEGGSAEHREA